MHYAVSSNTAVAASVVTCISPSLVRRQAQFAARSIRTFSTPEDQEAARHLSPCSIIDRIDTVPLDQAAEKARRLEKGLGFLSSFPNMPYSSFERAWHLCW